jgi:carboxypeptidase Taq
MGAFGYFPTYTLGNLYSAQLLQAARDDLESDGHNLEDDWRKGRFSPLLEWMRINVHSQGSILTPASLVEDATGVAPIPEPFVEYLQSKIGTIYGLT